MKRKSLPIILLLLTAAIFTGCIRDDRYIVQPDQPPVYQAGFSEEFDSDVRGWAFDDQFDSAYAFVQNGQYKFVDYSYTGGFHIASVPTGIPLNRSFVIQTSMSSNNAMALIFGASASDFGYSIFVDDQGYFAVYKEGYNPEVIIDWQNSSAIRTGHNDVEIEQANGYWYGYINGVEVFNTPARHLSGTECGFMVLANTTGYADYLRAKW